MKTPVSNITVLFMKDYLGNPIKQTFKCAECGFHICYRPKHSYGLTFLEGSFHCRNCKKECGYWSDDFQREELGKQLELFN